MHLDQEGAAHASLRHPYLDIGASRRAGNHRNPRAGLAHVRFRTGSDPVSVPDGAKAGDLFPEDSDYVTESKRQPKRTRSECCLGTLPARTTATGVSEVEIP